MKSLPFPFCATLATSLALAQPAPAASPLYAMLNAYRGAPPPCPGRPAQPLSALETHPALARVQVGTGIFLEHALERIGYPVAEAQAIYVSGPPDPRAVMEVVARRYCATLLDPAYTTVGVARSGDNWQIVFARPAPAPLASRLPSAADAGSAMLQAVNLARASPRACGAQAFPAAAPLAWNGALASAALAHSQDMAQQRYFNHKNRQGLQVAERAQQAGYRWRRIGENIAVGQESVDEALAGWLTSPGHCANIMSAAFTEMGAAYGIDPANGLNRAYWTQVFGTPR